MDKSRLLTKMERAYIIDKISGLEIMKEESINLSKVEEDNLIDSIISKIQAPQDLELNESG